MHNRQTFPSGFYDHTHVQEDKYYGVPENIALTAVRLYKLPPDGFWEMLDTCPQLRKSIIKISVQRSQIHEAVSQQQAKLISLGTLSAGLAHELNNPAAATKRGVQNLDEILQKLPTLALKLHQQPLTEEQLAFLTDLYKQATITAKTKCELDPLTRSEAEDAISDWLEDRDVAEAWKIAPTLVTAGQIHDRKMPSSFRVPPSIHTRALRCIAWDRER